jgi:hypothetical protein
MNMTTSSSYCWRCEGKHCRIVRDPLVPAWDRIGVCRACAQFRARLKTIYPERWKSTDH